MNPKERVEEILNGAGDPLQAAKNAIDHFQSVFDNAHAERNKHERLAQEWQAKMDEAQTSAGAWIYAMQDIEAGITLRAAFRSGV